MSGNAVFGTMMLTLFGLWIIAKVLTQPILRLSGGRRVLVTWVCGTLMVVELLSGFAFLPHRVDWRFYAWGGLFMFLGQLTGNLSVSEAQAKAYWN